MENVLVIYSEEMFENKHGDVNLRKDRNLAVYSGMLLKSWLRMTGFPSLQNK
jgi:hypothetical protein